MAWPIEEPTATPLNRVNNRGRCSGRGIGKLTLQSTPSGRTGQARSSGPGEEDGELGEGVAGIEEGGRLSSEVVVADGMDGRMPERRLLVW